MKLNKGFVENIFIVFMLSLIMAFSAFLSKQVKEVEIFKLKTVNNAVRNAKDKNVLVLGIAGFDSNGPLLTDVMMVANVNLEKGSVKAISIPRDLLVSIRGSKSFTKINNLLTVDNPNLKIKNTELIREKVEQITNLKIDNIVIVDLDGFRYFIDAIGGVNVYLEKTLYDPLLANPDNPNERFHLEAGWNYLDGKKAAKFVRSRYAATGDFSRISHQHDLLMAVFQKLKKLNAFTNPVMLYKIYSSWGGYLYTDFNVNDGFKFLPLAKNLDGKNIKFSTISYSKPEQLLVSTSSDVYGYFLMPKIGLEDYSEIHNYIYNFIY